jgi:hypothetical protein
MIVKMGECGNTPRLTYIKYSLEIYLHSLPTLFTGIGYAPSPDPPLSGGVLNPVEAPQAISLTG